MSSFKNNIVNVHVILTLAVLCLTHEVKLYNGTTGNPHQHNIVNGNSTQRSFKNRSNIGVNVVCHNHCLQKCLPTCKFECCKPEEFAAVKRGSFNNSITNNSYDNNDNSYYAGNNNTDDVVNSRNNLYNSGINNNIVTTEREDIDGKTDNDDSELDFLTQTLNQFEKEGAGDDNRVKTNTAIAKKRVKSGKKKVSTKKPKTKKVSLKVSKAKYVTGKKKSKSDDILDTIDFLQNEIAGGGDLEDDTDGDIDDQGKLMMGPQANAEQDEIEEERYKVNKHTQEEEEGKINSVQEEEKVETEENKTNKTENLSIDREEKNEKNNVSGNSSISPFGDAEQIKSASPTNTSKMEKDSSMKIDNGKVNKDEPKTETGENPNAVLLTREEEKIDTVVSSPTTTSKENENLVSEIKLQEIENLKSAERQNEKEAENASSTSTTLKAKTNKNLEDTKIKNNGEKEEEEFVDSTPSQRVEISQHNTIDNSQTAEKAANDSDQNFKFPGITSFAPENQQQQNITDENKIPNLQQIMESHPTGNSNAVEKQKEETNHENFSTKSERKGNEEEEEEEEEEEKEEEEEEEEKEEEILEQQTEDMLDGKDEEDDGEMVEPPKQRNQNINNKLKRVKSPKVSFKTIKNRAAKTSKQVRTETHFKTKPFLNKNKPKSKVHEATVSRHHWHQAQPQLKKNKKKAHSSISKTFINLHLKDSLHLRDGDNCHEGCRKRCTPSCKFSCCKKSSSGHDEEKATIEDRHDNLGSSTIKKDNTLIEPAHQYLYLKDNSVKPTTQPATDKQQQQQQQQQDHDDNQQFANPHWRYLYLTEHDPPNSAADRTTDFTNSDVSIPLNTGITSSRDKTLVSSSNLLSNKLTDIRTQSHKGLHETLTHGKPKFLPTNRLSKKPSRLVGNHKKTKLLGTHEKVSRLNNKLTELSQKYKPLDHKSLKETKQQLEHLINVLETSAEIMGIKGKKPTSYHCHPQCKKDCIPACKFECCKEESPNKRSFIEMFS